MTTDFGALLRLAAEPERLCDDLLTVHRWTFNPTPGDIRSLAIAAGRTYVTDAARLAFPNASVRGVVPTSDSVRKGDFGEMLAMGIYSTRMERTVPYTKLQHAKPYADATVQGPDTLSLTITQGEEVEPVTVEAKYRAVALPSSVLTPIEESSKNVTEEYLAQAWTAGVQMMHAHPDHTRFFALSAAQHLGRLIDPEAPLPPHARHAVAVVGEDRLSAFSIEQKWPGAPPITELHIVTVDDADNARNRIFDAAAELTYADLTGGASALVSPGTKAGVSGLISPDVPAQLRDTSTPHPLRVVLEASLWLLADEDGLARARAGMVTNHPDPDVRGLAALLTGALGRAGRILHGRPLGNFATAAREVLDLQAQPDRLAAALNATTLNDALLNAAQHVAAALIHRLDRHPQAMTEAQGANGAAVRHVVDRMRRVGRHAFWPSQAAAVRGGLLDQNQRSLAIKMPTSAGKTTLMQLVAADTIDRHPEGIVAVLAPSRALVGQLYRDLRDELPDDVTVRSSQGGLDYDTELPSTAEVLSGPGVAVLTPERFDLDWRRAVTDDGGMDLDDVKLLIVDEAQHVDNGSRGATLELLIAKALRRGIRVVLLASQFSNVKAIAKWLEGDPLESNWRPAWLERHVYTRGLPGTSPTRARIGYLWPEGADPVEVLTLKPSEKTKGDGWIRERRHEAAGLVDRWTSEGLVVVFTANKSLAKGLFDTIYEANKQEGPRGEALTELADSLEPLHQEEATALRNGFGLHHADVPRAVRRAIELAARRENGLLRCIVCTPTLLEGVDFPARTVIAAHPPRTGAPGYGPDIAKLRNLEGRAGRAGKFISGRLVVMTSDHEQARTWRRAMRQELPPTQTALTTALEEMEARAPEFLTKDSRDIIDAVTIEAIAESAAVDGELRRTLEEALQRTFWSATSAPQARDTTLNNGADYAAKVALRVPDAALRAAVYRSGLKLEGCLALRDAIARILDRIVEILRSEPWDADAHHLLLHWLLRACVAKLEELEELQDVPAPELQRVLEKWIAGTVEDDIAQDHPDAWSAVKPRHLEVLLVWALTGAFEIIAALAGDPQLREEAHSRLGPSRLRYGVFDVDLCSLVRDGADRVQVSRIAKEYLQEPQPTGAILLPLSMVVEDRIAEETKARAAADSAAAATPAEPEA